MSRRRKRWSRPRRKLEQAVRVVEGRVLHGYQDEQWALNSAGVWFRRGYDHASGRPLHPGSRAVVSHPKNDGYWSRWEGMVSFAGERKEPPAELRPVDLKLRVPVGATRDEVW